MRRYSFVGLIQVDFPGHTMRVCEGGFVRWGGEVFRSKDTVFGVIGDVEDLNEGVGEEVPVFGLKILPPGTTPAAQLSQPGHQTSAAQFWIGVKDIDAGTLVGTPELQFIGEIDQTTIEFAAQGRTVDTTIVSSTARLLERNIGNSLNPSWHKSVWPGETGHDQATSLGRYRAWGVESPRSSVAAGFSGVSYRDNSYPGARAQ